MTRESELEWALGRCMADLAQTGHYRPSFHPEGCRLCLAWTELRALLTPAPHVCPECGPGDDLLEAPPTEDEKALDLECQNFAMLVMQLCRKHPDDDLILRAKDFVKRMNRWPSPLREDPTAPARDVSGAVGEEQAIPQCCFCGRPGMLESMKWESKESDPSDKKRVVRGFCLAHEGHVDDVDLPSSWESRADARDARIAEAMVAIKALILAVKIDSGAVEIEGLSPGDPRPKMTVMKAITLGNNFLRGARG